MNESFIQCKKSSIPGLRMGGDVSRSVHDCWKTPMVSATLMTVNIEEGIILSAVLALAGANWDGA